MMQYKVFKTNEEFVSWQRDNEGAKVYVVAPVATQFNVVSRFFKGRGLTTPDFGIFITYSFDQPENPIQ